MRTWLTERFGLTVPVVAAPLAGVSTGQLAAAVSIAGGLGMFGAGPTTGPDRMREQCAVAREAGHFGVGLMAWALAQDDALVEVVAAQRPALVSLSYGPYERWIEPRRAAGIVVATQVGTLEEARAAEQAGIDLLVVRGGEGGGHGRADVATLPLLQGVLDAVQLPVLAAGGIATSRGLAAVLAAGCVGAWVGTAFLACTEAVRISTRVTAGNRDPRDRPQRNGWRDRRGYDSAGQLRQTCGPHGARTVGLRDSHDGARDRRPVRRQRSGLPGLRFGLP